MQGINLFPWRQVQYRRALKYFLLRLLLLFLCALGGYWGLEQINQQQRQYLAEQQEQLTLLNQKLIKQEMEISQQRRTLLPQSDGLTLASAKAIARLQLLHELPLLQGELTEVRLDSEQLDMAGNIDSQNAFAELHQFLQQRCGAVNLSQLQNEATNIAFRLQTACDGENK